MKNLLIIFITGCEINKKNINNYNIETLCVEVISYNPPKHFYITYKLLDGYKRTSYISKHCGVKENIIGTKVIVIKLTDKLSGEVIYELHNPRKDFCG